MNSEWNRKQNKKMKIIADDRLTLKALVIAMAMRRAWRNLDTILSARKMRKTRMLLTITLRSLRSPAAEAMISGMKDWKKEEYKKELKYEVVNAGATAVKTRNKREKREEIDKRAWDCGREWVGKCGRREKKIGRPNECLTMTSKSPVAEEFIQASKTLCEKGIILGPIA